MKTVKENTKRYIKRYKCKKEQLIQSLLKMKKESKLIIKTTTYEDLSKN